MMLVIKMWVIKTMKKFFIIILLSTSSLFSMNRNSRIYRSLQPLRTHVPPGLYSGFLALKPKIIKSSLWQSSWYPSNWIRSLCSSPSATFSGNDTNLLHRLVPVLVLGTTIYKTSAWNISVCADDHEDFTVDQIVEDFKKNSDFFMKKLQNDKALAHKYALFITNHCDEFLSKDKASALIQRILNDTTMDKIKVKDLIIAKIEECIIHNFVKTITTPSGLKITSFYCDYLQKNKAQEASNLYDQKMAIFADKFVNALEEILEILPCNTLADFFYYVVPHLEANIIKHNNNKMCEIFKKYNSPLVNLCQYKNSFTLYSLIKLFIKCNYEHEIAFVDELFRQYHNLENLYYLDIIQTEQGKTKALGYLLNNLPAASNKHEIMRTVRSWIKTNKSFAQLFVDEHSIKILLMSEYGHEILPLIHDAIPSVRTVISTLKNSL